MSLHKLPYERVIASMLLHKDNPKDIIEELASKEFSIPANVADLCGQIESKLHALAPEYFAKPHETVPDEPILIATDTMGYFYARYNPPYDPVYREKLNGYEGALKILEDTKMRRAIQSMAMAGITEEDIELMINARYDMSYSPDDINFYLKHFFDIEDWRVPQLKELIDSEPNPEFKPMYVLALKGDKGYLLWKLGLSPNRSYEEMMQEMMNDAFYMFKEASKQGKDHERAFKWSQVALKVAEKLEKADKEDTDANTLFQSFQFNMQAPTAPKVVVRAEDLGDDLPEFNLETSDKPDIPKLNNKKIGKL